MFLKYWCVSDPSTTVKLMRLCLANCSKLWTGVCMRSTVRNAARLAVNVANISTTNNQYAATNIRPDNALGASPPPCCVNCVP